MEADDLVDLLSEFVECVVHIVLKVRNIYPAEIFEKRNKYGVSIWHSRHPDINEYIRKVIMNAKPILATNVLDRFLLAAYDSQGVIVDCLAIKCTLRFHAVQGLNYSALLSMEDDLRAILLNCMMLDAKLPALQGDCTWTLMVATNDDGKGNIVSDASADQPNVINEALRSGQWIHDDTLLPENTAAQAGSDTAQIIPLKSLQNAAADIRTFVYNFR
jgi:hypothetical protein